MVREGLTFEEATRRIWALGIQSLLTEDSPQLLDFQVPYARPSNEVAAWSSRLGRAGYTLADVENVKPTMLIGTSTQAGAFSEPIVRLMAATAEVSAAVALAVAAAAEKEGLAQAPLDDAVQQVHQAMWRPQYPSFETI
jgi:malic enzyme